MNYAYARVSTDKQEHDRQKEILKNYKIDEMVFEVISGGKEAKKRPKFAELCEKLKQGDYIYFADLSRFGRSTVDVLNTTKELIEKYKVNLVFVKENLRFGEDFEDDYMSQFVLNIFASLNELERKQIGVRVKDGLAAARAKGHYGGRPKNFEIREKVIDRLRRGFTQKEICEELDITQPYVSRIKKEYMEAKKQEEDVFEF